MNHELKTWPEYFQAVASGLKPFELRRDDRGYEVGDLLWLREFDPVVQGYTGQELTAEVTYLLVLNDFVALESCPDRYVILGISLANASVKEHSLIGSEPLHLRTSDHPLATDTPGPGWKLDMPLVGGRTLFLEIGREGRDALLEMFVRDAADEDRLADAEADNHHFPGGA